MSVENEIEYRKQLLESLYTGKKITKDEKEWLQTHIAYSNKYGYPFVVRDIINLTPNVEYIIKVELVVENSKNKMSPIFIIPLKKGHIKSDYSVKDIYDKVSTTKVMSVLSTCNTKNNPYCQLKCLSKTGLLGISYECETTDYRGIKYMIDSTFAEPLAMKKEKLADNKIQYSCSDFQSEEFNKYVFTVEWIEENESN